MGSGRTGKFDDFERRDYVYSKVKDHSILVSVLWPRKAREEHDARLPIMTYFHGGGYVMGGRLYEPWFSDWLIELARREDAMMVTPDYRLLPEAEAGDLVEDTHNFWDWFAHSLPEIAEIEAWPVRPNLNRTLCVGQSAGGIPAVQSSLLRPDLDIRAVISMYAPLVEKHFVNARGAQKFWGLTPPPPRQAELIIRSYIRKNKGKVRTSGDPLELGELAACLYQQCYYKRFRNTGKFKAHETLEVVEGSKGLPPAWFIHGDVDSVVPTPCTTEFVEHYQKMFPEDPSLLLSVRPGDHVFDVSMSIDEDWIMEGIEMILDYW